MNCLSIVFCGNHETLGTDHEGRDAYVSSVLQLAPADFRIDENREFRHWNGGPGHGNGFAYVRLTGYGPVKDIDDCRKALGFMLSGGGPEIRANVSYATTQVDPPDEWPSSEDVAAAFELLDRIREVPVPEAADADA